MFVLSVHEQIFTKFLSMLPEAVAWSIVHRLARCDTLCTPGFIDDIIFAHNGSYGGMSVRLQRVTSLRQGRACCVTASYWLRRVLDDDGSGGGVSETDRPISAPLP